MGFVRVLYLVSALSHVHFNSLTQTLNLQFHSLLMTLVSLCITPMVIYFNTELIMHLPS
jgi:hypothetical protein